MRRVFPDAAEIAPEEAVAGLAGRETLVVNMVASTDGRAALGGASAPLSAPADRELFHVLRAQADAVLVGAGTLRAERYRRITKNDELRARREAAGLAPEPVCAVVARTPELEPDLPILQDPEARVAVYTGDDLAAVLADLRATHGARCVLCEGGPRLNARLFAAELVQELFLTLSPLVAGEAGAPGIVEGDLPAPARLELRQAIEADSALMLRYGVIG